MDHWSRRQFVQGAGAAGLGLLPGCGRWPWQGQPPRVYRIGYLSPGIAGGSFERGGSNFEAFGQGLRELGYAEGENIVIEVRSAEGDAERLPALAAELVRLPVDVVVAPTPSTVRAAQTATAAIPIVMAVVGDPVELGFIASLARPGGNVTGPSFLQPQLS